ncbi:MAG: FtsL-like putative cell division protein [Microbacter sp.]
MNTSPVNPVDVESPSEDVREHWTFRDVLSGKILTTKFIRKQFFLFIFLCGIAIFYIDNRYTCELQIAKINKLEDELTNIKYEALTTSTTLMQLSKESQVAVMVKEKGIDLAEPLQPEIVINKK